MRYLDSRPIRFGARGHEGKAFADRWEATFGKQAESQEAENASRTELRTGANNTNANGDNTKAIGESEPDPKAGELSSAGSRFANPEETH